VKTQIREKIVEKQINKLESFLKEIEAKYEVQNQEVRIYGEVMNSIFFNREKWIGYDFSLQFKIDEKTFLNLNFYKNSIELNTCKNNQLLTKKIRNISYIFSEQNKLYIVF